ncbi:MAG: DUF4290 domain-containing protein [Crocinitomicaceae bacterium]|nr:DUF4290 domain-containing protein [Crocinitomicaceae bacterium]
MSTEITPLEYNSQRPDLTIPESGRNIQTMVEIAMTLDTRDERPQCCKAILSVMGQLFPYLRDIEDFNHKLWDHLYIMSNFKLDVDSPYPIPKPEELDSPPDRIPYPQGEMRFGHYGRYAEKMISKCAEMADGEEKQAFTLAIANLMKQNSLNWNRNTVTDDVILKDLNTLGKGKINVEGIPELNAVKTLPGNKFQDFDDGYSNKKQKNQFKKKKFKKFK